MNEWEKNRRMAESYRQSYPPGTRLELIGMDDPFAPIPAGMRGTVNYVDDQSQIHVKWDNGSGLALIPDTDSFRRLSAKEIEAENAAKGSVVSRLTASKTQPGKEREEGRRQAKPNKKEGGYAVMKVLMVEPGKVPYAAEIGEGLEPLQAAVGGDIQAVYPYDDPVALICNEEGKYMGLPLNRALHDDEGNIYDIVAGNFFLCGLGEEDFTDLPADLMEKYRQQFEHPEQFVRIAGKILAVKQPVPSPEEQEAQRAQMAAQEAQREEMRLDESTDLAFDLDVFLRQYSDAYADMHPVFHEEKERMADELLSGQTGKIRMRMATVIQEEHLNGEAGPLLDRIAAYEKEYGISAYSIYQLDLSDSTDDLRFMSLDWLEKKGLPVDRDNYQMVYAAELSPGETLEDIYTRFNIDHPEDFKGHSLSVSDVVVLHEKGSDTAYYVDSIGFKEVPDFLGGARQPEAKRDVSLRELLDDAKKQAAKAEPKTPEKKKEPERS